MQNEIKEVKKDVKDILVKVAEMPEKIFEKCDSRYASIEIQKDVNKFKNWLIYFSLSALVGLGVVVIFLVQNNKQLTGNNIQKIIQAEINK